MPPSTRANGDRYRAVRFSGLGPQRRNKHACRCAVYPSMVPLQCARPDLSGVPRRMQLTKKKTAKPVDSGGGVPVEGLGLGRELLCDRIDSGSNTPFEA